MIVDNVVAGNLTAPIVLNQGILYTLLVKLQFILTCKFVIR
jgi:hypothetical protein